MKIKIYLDLGVRMDSIKNKAIMPTVAVSFIVISFGIFLYACGLIIIPH
jgi:hypothetical protein